MPDALRIGVIGAGRIGKVHAKTLHTLVPGVEVAAVSDVMEGAAKSLAADLGIGRALKDYREILADPGIKAVAICSSTDTHAMLIEEAAKAGKHVFCEKPIALDLGKIDRALKAVADNKVILMLGFNRRYDVGNARLHQAVKDGLIGKPEMCVINSRDPSPPPLEYVKISGGIFLDMMIHDFDLSRFLLGDEPEEVYSCAACLVDPEIGKAGDYDTAMVTIRFKQGAICHIDNSRRAVYGYDQRAEVFGSKGSVSTLNLHNDNTILARVDGYALPPIQNFFMERYMPAYQAEGIVFAKCVKDGGQPPCGGLDGRLSVIMGLAALKSAKENRPVKISEVEA